MSGRGIRIHRWADAPNELRRQIDPGKRLAYDWLAEVPPHKALEAEGDFGWIDPLRIALADGSLLVAGRERGSS